MPDANFTPFNLATMSGVFPGTRTQIFQRVRLQKIEDATDIRWGQIFWYDSPPSCVVIAKDSEKAKAAGEFLLRLEGESTMEVHQQLLGELARTGWSLKSCGNCEHWQPTQANKDDAQPFGRCTLHAAVPNDLTKAGVPDVLAVQSSLALDCPHWQMRQGAAKEEQQLRRVEPLTKVAEVSESKLKPLQRFQRQIGRWLGTESAPDFNDWRQKLLERSGVGAGTEPCFVCQGRIANLGALTVESTAGDKQTFSVWRCRSCYSLYLSDWTDRWERLENLETEEIVYRIAPVEATELLDTILGVPGGEHPAQRSERAHLREWMLDYVSKRPILSRQIKQGR